ncbi:thioredoxin domain-containing protein [Nitrosomonas sp. Is37]|uniref:thioredoxin domain-containing protein n=1 Tax=Nitrosomonas sp. Is37 TaxID=3080535 RepID=UPI00294AD504|nr:thioredoxin domain-containing protein [Nitrosomonas sp. Is37]MDV6343222.1 thioredoxin domain-containing protein [Nitrosomonas sp. Is37]
MPNHLAGETSPYLLQHADNPVDWYPWGEEALVLARTQNKPILLSIGYSACHWCHVMAQESFEDQEVAAAMNEYFINIKVDREERPDLDQIYQTAHYMLNHRHGGWPLTMFLTPEQKPFFGGTYFPKEPRHGMPGFLELLPKIAEIYHTRREDIEQQNSALLKILAETLPATSVNISVFSRHLIEQAITQLLENFDREYGGFGSAPKFLHPAELKFCLQCYFSENDTQAQYIVAYTLEKMANGGIYDQLGGGFYRYSTDQYWRIPHFEKMLYDNGPLLQLYADAWLATHNSLFKRIVEETAAWVMREMQFGQKEGGYYSALDADSEHEEGKFYVWDKDEIACVLTADEYTVIAPYYGLSRLPNFENKYWHLEINQSVAAIANDMGISQEEVQQRIESARHKLFNKREQRVHPGRDEKTLASWNGLMIRGMARAGMIFGGSEWIKSAMLAVDFIRTTLWKNNRLLATFKDGKAHLNAYLDDYAFLLDGLLELMQVEFRQSDLDFAIALAEVLLDQFEDKQLGGFFFTSHDHEKLIHRPKTGQDNAIPSGNGLAAISLQRLGHLLGEYRYLQSAERTLKLFYPEMRHHPSVYCSLLIALKEWLTPPQIVILRGKGALLSEWHRALVLHAPATIVLALPMELTGLPPSLNKPLSVDQGVNAWVCQGEKCLPEITDLQELLQACKVKGRMLFPL